MASRIQVTLAGAVMAAGLVLTPVTRAAEIGSVGAVNVNLFGTKPISSQVQLIIGDFIVQDELVETTKTGSGELLFLDQTTLSIGPDSEVLLDKYIYDPDRRAGEVALKMAAGAMRFIGGQITKSSEGTVNTPHATIAIRGGMAVMDAVPGEVTVVNLASSYVAVTQNCDLDGDGLDDGTLCPNGPLSEVVLSRPGAIAKAGPNGVRFAGLASAKVLADLYGKLDGVGSGGLQQQPSVVRIDEGVARITPLNGFAIGGPYGRPVSTTGEMLAGTGYLDEEPSDPNEANIRFDSVAETIGEGSFDGRNLADPAIIATLTGISTYAGLASGVEMVAGGASNPVSGSFNMSYDFGNRSGTMNLDIANSTFTTNVQANAANIATYSGTSPIFGGNGAFSAEGGFYSSPSDPRAETAGNFLVDLPSLSREISGTFDGPRTN